ncbi:hypothetical protein ACFWC5_37890 [Streptomyces sp. NPDC060085]|uniref:hypothetical protein n=1 Tax=Streptomyces sp. NPDC060085 TaxID=3347054 RepID=UPI003647692E
MHIKPLLASLDRSGLARTLSAPLPTSSTAARPVQGETMSQSHGFGDTVTITSDEMREILARIQPYLPTYLLKMEPAPYGLRFTFAPFTGREAEPIRPAASYDDPRLTYVREDVDAAEHKLRVAGRDMLADVYQQARELWKDAAYVADLRDVVKDAPARWQAYERELKSTEAAFAYLRTPEAGREWPAPICRLVDAHERLTAAATSFEERGREIARVNETHLYADLGRAAALERAGHPDGRAWLVGSAYEGFYDATLIDKVRRLIEQQESHLAHVSRLSGTPTT